MTILIPEDIAKGEELNTGTSMTGHGVFDKLGYLPLESLWDPAELICEVPEKRGQFNYTGTSLEEFNHIPIESQVEGSVSRYWYPQYRDIHTGIRLKLEKILGRKLYNTYYYDRFYFPGQDLKVHIDRDACEISVTIHVGTNLTGTDAEWPIGIKCVDGEAVTLSLEPGDAVLYKGCERPHWREPMPKPRRRKRDIILRRPEKEYYYHQIFFHYVLVDGERAHCAWDRSR
tara:strand:- start:46 stop:735 length:690 start_codon:yes stop_codon:yes gene_type:complete